MHDVFVFATTQQGATYYPAFDGVVIHYHTFAEAKTARPALEARFGPLTIRAMSHVETACPHALSEAIRDLASSWRASFRDINSNGANKRDPETMVADRCRSQYAASAIDRNPSAN